MITALHSLAVVRLQATLDNAEPPPSPLFKFQDGASANARGK